MLENWWNRHTDTHTDRCTTLTTIDVHGQHHNSSLGCYSNGSHGSFNRIRQVAPLCTQSDEVKLAFHDADTDFLERIFADSPDTPTFSRRSSRGCRCQCRRRGMRAGTIIRQWFIRCYIICTCTVRNIFPLHLAPCTLDNMDTVLFFQKLNINLTSTTLFLVPFLVMSKLCVFYVHVCVFYMYHLILSFNFHSWCRI